jgi:peptidoglycan/LPS O-acetylase OafA/YrhL
MTHVLVYVCIPFLAYLALGYGGYIYGLRVKTPAVHVTILVLLAVTFIAGSIMVGGMLVSWFGVNFYINFLMQAFIMGVVVGMYVDDVRKRKAATHAGAAATPAKAG